MDDNSTAATATATPPPPPPAGGSLRFIKVSEGRLKYKPDKTADYEELAEVVGTLKRVAIRTTEWNGQELESAECEIIDADGLKNIVEVSTQNSVGCGMFMAGLCLLKEGEYICVRAHPSRDKNKFGKFTTFMDFKVYDPVTRNWSDARIENNAPGQTWRDRIDGVRVDFEALPFYKERESGGSDKEAGEFDLFCQTVDGKGWKPVRQNEDAYLAWINAATGNSHAALSDIDEDDWAELRQLVGMAKKTPPALAS